MPVDAEKRCSLQQVEFEPGRWQWSKVGRPGGYSHINTEEAAALVWSVHDRLRRPGECGKKAVHLIDSAVVAGAAKKAEAVLAL